MAGIQRPATTTLGTIFRQHSQQWLASHPAPARYHKVIRAITDCRSPAMGGRRQWCVCGYERFVYFSCRNRHCPSCQTKDKEQWRVARQSELLPVPYFHLVFTLPHQLNRLVLWNERSQRTLLKLLFDSVAETLLKFGRQELRGQLGFTLVLHTWDQRLNPHIHLHCLLPSGALVAGENRWASGGSRFLFSVRALSKVYRGIFLAGLRKLWEENDLDLPPDLANKDEHAWSAWCKRLRKHSWVVYAKPPFTGPKKLLDYLSRYTHKVAISNERIVSCRKGQVEFTYRDRRDGDRRKTDSLPADEFISRFLKHVLPSRFTRIRHYGFLSNRNKGASLKQIRALLGDTSRYQDQDDSTGQQLLELFLTWARTSAACCPDCGRSLYQELLEPALPMVSEVPVTTLARAPP